MAPPYGEVRIVADRNGVYLKWLAFALLAASGLQVIRLLAGVSVLAPQDFNEGWNALHAQALAQGLPLYPGVNSLFDNNYPPLSFHAAGLMTLWIPDFIVAGRVVATFAFFVLLLLTGLTARAMGGESWLAGAYLAAIFLAFSHYPGMNDPQMLGHAIAAFGLLLLFRAPQQNMPILAAAVLLALAGFVKQNLVVLPVTASIWLLLQHPRAAANFMLAGLGAAGVFWGVCEAAYGPGFLGHLLASRVYDAAGVAGSAARWLLKTSFPLAALLWAAWRWRDNRALLFCALYAAVGSLSGIYFIGGAGVDQNVFFDAYIALALGFSLAARLALQETASPWIRGLGMGAFLLPLLVAVFLQSQPDWRQRQHWFAPRQADAVDGARVVAALRGVVGPALCGEPAYCLWADKGRGADPFGYSQGVATGRLAPDLLQNMIRQRSFRSIQGGAASWGQDLIRLAREQGYRPVSEALGDDLLALPP